MPDTTWTHIRRVRKNALMISSSEKISNTDTIELCAMFHDVGDHKFNDNPGKVFDQLTSFLVSSGIANEVIDEVLFVARNISFSLGEKRGVVTPVMAVVMDADRLDAMGAIGIARAFSYGGFRNRPMYSASGPGSTIFHFHEKLLLLKELMNTDAGKRMATHRHDFMIRFLKEFERETGFSTFDKQ